MSGETVDPTTELTGTKVDCAQVTVQTGETTGLEAQERVTVEDSNGDNPVLTTKVSSAKVTGTIVKKVPG